VIVSNMTEPTSRWPNLAASLTLLISAGLVVWGSFSAVIVDTVKLSGGSVVETRVTMWGEVDLKDGQVVEDRSQTVLIGIVAVVAAVLLVSAAVAVLRATRTNGRGPRARALTGLAAGWAAGGTAFVGTIVLNALDGEPAPDYEVAVGLGMWLLLVATVLTVAVAIALTVRDLATPRPAPGVHLWAERAPGVIPLAVAGVVAIVAGFLALLTRTTVREGGNLEVSRTLWGQRVNGAATAGSPELVSWGLPVTVAAGLLFVGAALLLVNDRNLERRRIGMFGRLTGSFGAGMLGGLVTGVVMITVDTLFNEWAAESRGRESTVDIGVGTYLLAAAVLIAVFGAIRGGKPVGTLGTDSVTSQAQPG
jgi:hypothetical protein